MATHSVQTVYTSPSGQISYSISNSASQNVELDVPIAANQTNFEIDLAIPVSPELLSFFLFSKVAMTIKTNSSGSPQETISLTAGVAYQWENGSGVAIPLLGALTKLFVTNTTAGTLSVRALFGTVPNNV